MATNPIPQVPAEGIYLNREFGDSKFYSVACECGSPDDEIKLNVEADEGGITVHVWTTVKTPWWSKAWDSDLWIAGLWNGLSRRLSQTWRLWTCGYIECESWTILSKQQAINFAAVLESSVNDVEEFQNAAKTTPKERATLSRDLCHE